MQRDELYVKYRVFREPDADTEDGHPVRVEANFLSGHEYGPEGVGEIWEPLEELGVNDGPFFVLRPEKDPHARIALATYAASCAEDFPQKAEDIFGLLGIS